MKINNPAPVVLFVYNRHLHTAQTLEALAKNRIASNSNLFIFSDGPKDESDFAEIKKIRKILQSLVGFNNVKLFFREKNLGLALSIKTGVTEILRDRDRVIVLEDDLVTSPAFLDYMNSMLQNYQERKEIFSISGFNYPRRVMKIPPTYSYDIYFSPRPSSWGWGTWKDRWELADWDPEVYNQLKGNKELIESFNQGGEDLNKLMRLNYKGLVDSWAILWSYTLFTQGGFCVYPSKSYVRNIGFGDLATHTSGKDKYKHNTLNMQVENFQLPKTINLNPEILISFQNIFRKKWIFRYYEEFKRKYIK